MEYYEEHTVSTVIRHKELVVTNHNDERISMNFQPAFDVLKSVGLDQYISEKEREFLRVQ